MTPRRLLPGLLVLLSLAAAALGAALPLRSLAQGAYSGVGKEGRHVVTSQAEWEKLWKQHAPKPENAGAKQPPKVDWEREMVLAAFMGTRNTGGYAIRIDEAREVEGKLVVTVSERKPAPGDITAQVITAPFHFAAVKRSALPARWQVTAVKR